MMPITTNSSTSVNPRRVRLEMYIIQTSRGCVLLWCGWAAASWTVQIGLQSHTVGPLDHKRSSRNVVLFHAAVGVELGRNTLNTTVGIPDIDAVIFAVTEAQVALVKRAAK